MRVSTKGISRSGGTARRTRRGREHRLARIVTSSDWAQPDPAGLSAGSTPPRPRRKSIATVALSGTLADKLEAAAAVGFDGVEVMESDLLTFDGSPEDVRRMAADLDLTIDLYQPFRDFEAMPEPQRTRNLDRAERKFDVMQALGTDLILVCSNTQPATLDDDARAAADLHAMAERAARRGLRIGFEALSWARHIRLWGHAWRIVRDAGHPALGLIVDSFHTLALGDDPAGIADVPGDRIFYVQLADAPRRSMDVLSWSRHHRSFPYQGDLPIDGFVRAVLASGYRGPLSLEVFNDHFRAAPARMIARDGLRSLVLAEALATGPGALPALPDLDGIAFLEFAVDGPAGDELADLLLRLGFHHAGRHRSKAVHLYRQGRIHLILNSEQDTAASERFQHHGPSVCAMALRVDDPARVVARARALLIPDWRERTGAGERQIPAVRGPDGTLIYLVGPEADGDGWQDDFDMLAGGPAESAGLDAVDHLAMALPAGHLDTYVLFWRSLFGLTPQPVLDLPDPYGLVQSRAMADPGGSVRLTFNISGAQETVTNRMVSTFAGAGVHHIAFATLDAAETAARLDRLGAPKLVIPANYYEDVAARLDLDDATAAGLARLGLLYDQDAGGTFRHAYTEAFQNRFFFEAVERRGGYAGFGAPNAAVRMAAQARQQPVRI
ncbi:MAG: sugar phosphate isomerase/epimerase and 4-hydroxyphenylpyruvate domain-containing protein [Gemmatimonadaceae bacterium]|nr:sugar phosphate isomerase/epimerase and 4-hydroxyphenylpyruvate domain-containing protein [Acetobacteraceae bacterium]